MTAPPIPDPDIASARFFQSLNGGQLSLLRCARCDTPYVAALSCDVCGATEFSDVPASGRGTIYSFTRVHTAHHPAFADRLPFTGGIVELEEGPRLFAPLVGDGSMAIGDPVVCMLQESEGRTFAAFRVTEPPKAG